MNCPRLFTTWRSFWFTEIPGQIYAVIRIALGLVGLAALGGLADLELYWLPGGLESVELSSLRQQVASLGWEQPVALAIFYLSCASTLSMTLGLFTGITVPLTFLLSIVHTTWNPLPMSSAFSVYRCLVFCLVWADSGSQLSIDRWLIDRKSRKCQRPLEDHQPIWPLRLMRFQIGLIYLSAALWKISYAEWHSGAALHYVLAGAGFNRFSPPPIYLDPVVVAASYVILTWELLFVPLVIYRPTRTLTLWFGVVAHLSMGIVLELGVFSAVMLIGYLAFLDPGRVAAWSSIRSWRDGFVLLSGVRAWRDRDRARRQPAVTVNDRLI